MREREKEGRGRRRRRRRRRIRRRKDEKDEKDKGAKSAKRLKRAINGESDAQVIIADIILSLCVPRPIIEEPHYGVMLPPGLRRTCAN